MSESSPRIPVIVRVSDRDRLSVSTRDLQRRAAAKTATRLRRGVYVDRRLWKALPAHEQHLVRIAAVVGSRRERPVLFGVSAAMVLGLPLYGIFDESVHLLAREGVAPASKNGVRWHRHEVAETDIIEVAGFRVTGVERTVLDLARGLTFSQSISAVDRSLQSSFQTASVEYRDGRLYRAHPVTLPGIERGELLGRLQTIERQRGVARAGRVVRFADPLAASPGESVSRAKIAMLGFPAPRLQVAFARLDGGEDIVDFDWPDHGIVGEFDGKVKYTRQEYLKDRDVSEVVWAEKLRERRIKRGHGRDVGRWVWADLGKRADGMRRELLAAGLPLTGTTHE